MPPQFSSTERSLDPQSSHTLRRFAIIILFMLAWSVAARPQDPLQALMVMTSAAIAMECLLGALRRERFNAVVLNHWDSACAFFAVNCLLRRNVKPSDAAPS